MTIWPKGSTNRIRLCSRPHPRPAEREWTPQWRDVARVETLLPYAMREWWGRRQPPRPDRQFAAADHRWRFGSHFEKGDWERQFTRNYFGLVREGRRILYIDFSPASFPDGFGVCDGGGAFFGIELDVQTMRVTSFEENGVG